MPSYFPDHKGMKQKLQDKNGENYKYVEIKQYTPELSQRRK